MRLATSRLILREVEIADARSLALYQRDARYLEHYSNAPTATEIVRLARTWALDRPRLNYQLSIATADADALIGCAGVRQAGHPPGEAEVGIELDPHYWGAGYAREALSALVALARDDLGLTELSALSARTNFRAHHLLRSLRFAESRPHGEDARFALSLAAA